MKSTSREKILSAVKKNKPESVALPETPLFNDNNMDLISRFEFMVETAAGRFSQINPEDSLEELIGKSFSNDKKILSISNKVKGNVDLEEYPVLTDFDGIDLTIIEGELGVAENGAVWVKETKMGRRVLPFITQHLLIILDKTQIVGNMTEAYQKIKIDEDGFGVFIAGPSKTADIEQSLVIGAQGARSFWVVVRD